MPVKGWPVDDELLSLCKFNSICKISSPKFFDTDAFKYLIFFSGGREGGREGEDERFLRDILEFLHLNRIYHVGKYFETLERKIFGQFFEGGRSKYFLIFQLCRMLNGVDNIGKYFRSKKLNLGKKVV